MLTFLLIFIQVGHISKAFIKLFNYGIQGLLIVCFVCVIVYANAPLDKHLHFVFTSLSALINIIL